MGQNGERHSPIMSAAEAQRRIAWQEKIYQEHLRESEACIQFLGLTLVVSRDVLQPAPPDFNLLAASVLKEVCNNDPAAVLCARRNAARNGVADRVEVRRSDLFQNVSGRFDLILFDPPFRWTAPRDLWEQASADPGYSALQAFLRESKKRLTKGGRIILHFGTSGDLPYFKRLIRQNGFRRKQLLKASHPAGWQYFTYRLTP